MRSCEDDNIHSNAMKDLYCSKDYQVPVNQTKDIMKGLLTAINPSFWWLWMQPARLASAWAASKHQNCFGTVCFSKAHSNPFGLSWHQYRPVSSCHPLFAQPKRGNVVDSYATVTVQCSTCGERLFRYKKKNGTKSQLVKCFRERIVEDSAGVLNDQGPETATYVCPSCQTVFARSAIIRGLPALKLVGGKTRMTKR